MLASVKDGATWLTKIDVNSHEAMYCEVFLQTEISS